MWKSLISMLSIILSFIFSELFLRLNNIEEPLFGNRFDLFRLFADVTIWVLIYVIVYYSLYFFSKGMDKPRS